MTSSSPAHATDDERPQLVVALERKLAPGESSAPERVFKQLTLPSRRGSLIRALEKLLPKHSG
jgi:hypothetical protein